MKYTKWLVAMVGAAMLTSCVDDFDTNDYVVTKPGNSEDYEYLNEYEPLKNYVDRSAHPNFKVSAALNAGEFNNRGNLFTLARANFDEIVAGNAMKMSSVVSDKGEFNWGTVQSFVSAAESGDLSIYGHTLAWHSQQPVKWLNSLIADRKIEIEGAEETETFTPVKKRVIKVEAGDLEEAAWDTQFWLMTNDILHAGDTYELSYESYAYLEASVGTQLHKNPGEYVHWAAVGNFSFAPEWETHKATGTIPSEGEGTFSIALNINDKAEANTYYFANLSLKINGVEQLNNGDLSGDDNSSFFTKEKRGNVVSSTILDEYLKRELVMGGGVSYEEVTTTINKRVIKVAATEMVDQPWDNQFWIVANNPFNAGDSWEVSMEIRADKEAAPGTQIHGKEPGSYLHWAAIGNPKFTTEWTTFEASGTIANEGNGGQSIAFNLNDFADANNYYFGNISFKVNGVEQVNNGDLATSDNSSFYEKLDRGNPVPSTILDKYTMTEIKEVSGTKTTHVDKRVIIVDATEMVEQPWDNQFWIVANNPFNAGDSWEVEMEIKGEKNAAPGTQIHGKDPGSYMHWAAIGNPSFGEDWSVFKVSGTIPNEGNGGQSIAFNLNDFADANKYYFGKISFKVNGVEQVNNPDFKTNDASSFYQKLDRGNPVVCTILDGYDIVEEIKSTVPLTPEEKKDTLMFAMKKWVDGMMNATEGKVKAWDLINEAISGGGNVNGYYDLQHFEGYETGKWDVGGDAFYWQDYFGSEEYGVIMEKLAREAYAAQEGANPADLKLFINDYNLESTWDNNKKLESLIYWIGVWESKGAKIDGIGTQMHISYIRDAAQQENQKKHITRMFELMAKTGKLVRISELDMGLCDKQFGEGVKTTDMTFADEKAMADYYQWIVEEYFRVIPVAQQYGICQWCITDAPASSGWRGGEPVGLWYQDYTRKPAYAGWAEGLKK